MTLEFTSFHSVAFLVYALIIQHFKVAVNLFSINIVMTNTISYCKILDLPAIPDHLVQQALAIIQDQSKSYIAGRGPVVLKDSNGANTAGSTYNRYHVSPELFEWAVANIPGRLPNKHDNFKIGIQVFRPIGINTSYDPHTDGPRGEYVLNYLIDAGGDNVLTKWYQEVNQPLVRTPGINLKSFQNLTEVHSEHIQAGSWFCLYSRVLHTVTNIERPRISLSIGLNEPLT
jgi:hypothetical protein